MAISASDLPIPTPDLLRALIQRNFNSARYINHLKTMFPNQVSYIDKTVHELEEAKFKVSAGDSKTSQEGQILDRTKGPTLKSAMSPKAASFESPPASPFINISKDGISASPNPTGKKFHAGFRAALKRKQAETKQDAERRGSISGPETLYNGRSELNNMIELCKLLQEDKILTLKQLKEIVEPSDIPDIEKDSRYSELKDTIKSFIKTLSPAEDIKILGEGIHDIPKQTIETREHKIPEKINLIIQFFTHAHIKTFIRDIQNTLTARGVAWYSPSVSPATTPGAEPWFRRKLPITKTPKPQLGPAPEPESDTSHIRIHVENSAPSVPPFIPSAAMSLADPPSLSRRGSNSSITSFVYVKNVTGSPSLIPKDAPSSPLGTLSISEYGNITSFFEQLLFTILEHKLLCPTNQEGINNVLKLMKLKIPQSHDQSQAQAKPGHAPAKPDQ